MRAKPEITRMADLNAIEQYTPVKIKANTEAARLAYSAVIRGET